MAINVISRMIIFIDSGQIRETLYPWNFTRSMYPLNSVNLACGNTVFPKASV